MLYHSDFSSWIKKCKNSQNVVKFNMLLCQCMFCHRVQIFNYILDPFGIWSLHRNHDDIMHITILLHYSDF